MNAEYFVIAVIVGCAVLYVARAVHRSLRGRSKCGCGSAKCPAAREAADRLLRSAGAPRKDS